MDEARQQFDGKELVGLRVDDPCCVGRVTARGENTVEITWPNGVVCDYKIDETTKIGDHLIAAQPPRPLDKQVADMVVCMIFEIQEKIDEFNGWFSTIKDAAQPKSIVNDTESSPVAAAITESAAKAAETESRTLPIAQYGSPFNSVLKTMPIEVRWSHTLQAALRERANLRREHDIVTAIFLDAAADMIDDLIQQAKK